VLEEQDPCILEAMRLIRRETVQDLFKDFYFQGISRSSEEK